MTTKPEQFLARLIEHLVGRRVSYRRLACDSLLVYKAGATIWFEPPWHFRGPQGVLVGSNQAARAADAQETLDAVASLMDVLDERTIVQIVVEPLTHDLTVTFEGGYSIKTFVSDPTDDESWHIRENATGARLKGSPAGLSIVTR